MFYYDVLLACNKLSAVIFHIPDCFVTTSITRGSIPEEIPAHCTFHLRQRIFPKKQTPDQPVADSGVKDRAVLEIKQTLSPCAHAWVNPVKPSLHARPGRLPLCSWSHNETESGVTANGIQSSLHPLDAAAVYQQGLSTQTAGGWITGDRPLLVESRLIGLDYVMAYQI